MMTSLYILTIFNPADESFVTKSSEDIERVKKWAAEQPYRFTITAVVSLVTLKDHPHQEGQGFLHNYLTLINTGGEDIKK